MISSNPGSSWLRVGLGLLILAGGLALTPTRAGSEDVSPTPEQITERNQGLLGLWDAMRERTAGMRVRGETGLVSTGEFGGARTWWSRTGLAVDGGLPLSDRVSLAIGQSIAYERLDFAGSGDLTTSTSGRDSHISNFLDATFRVGANGEISHGFGAELVTSLNLRQEVGAAFDESLQIGGSLAATYRRGTWLRLRLGVGLGTDLGDRRLRVTPVYRIRVRPRKGLVLAATGTQGSIEWDLSRQTRLSLSGGVEGTQYRLDRQQRPPNGLGSGVLQRRQAHVTLGAVQRIGEKLRLRLDLGVILDQKLTIIDEDDNDVDARQEKDPSAQFMIGLEYRL